MSRPFGYEELLQRMNDAGVDRAILIPPSMEGDRNDYAREAAHKHPDRFAVMGRIPLNIPRPPSVLARWRDQPGMLGVRVVIEDDTSHWLTDGTSDWFWKAAANSGVPVMAPTRTLAAPFHQILRRNPELILIIDHMGVTVELARAGLMEKSIEDTLSFARYPNVSVKMSAIAHKSAEPYPFRDVAPYIHRVFDAFGPRRCFWGTDLTTGLENFSYTYRQRVTHFTETLDFLSEDDKDWIMGRAILRRLGWKEPAQLSKVPSIR